MPQLRIPLPEVRFRMDRRSDGTLAFVPATDRPLSPGVIRYTTDDSPVTAESAVYTEPFVYEEGITPTSQAIEFDQITACRYLKIEANSLYAGENMKIVELEAYSK